MNTFKEQMAANRKKADLLFYSLAVPTVILAMAVGIVAYLRG